jgi:hypothetical protein
MNSYIQTRLKSFFFIFLFFFSIKSIWRYVTFVTQDILYIEV